MYEQVATASAATEYLACDVPVSQGYQSAVYGLVYLNDPSGKLVRALGTPVRRTTLTEIPPAGKPVLRRRYLWNSLSWYQSYATDISGIL